MSTLEWTLVIVGFVGYGTFVAGLTRIRTWTARQSFLRLAYDEPADIVVTTSANVLVGAHQVIGQSAVSLGDLEGAAAFSRAIGDLRRKKSVLVHPSEEESYALDNDLVLLGGPRANHITLAFLRHLKWAHPELRLAFAEQTEEHCVVAAEGLRIHYEPGRQRRTVGDTRLPPKEDFAIAVAWVNPFTIRPRRAFLCAGFTSLGTAAAARYLLREVMNRRFTGLSAHGAFRGLLRLMLRPRYWREGWRWRVWTPPCFLLILRFEFTGLSDYEVQEVKFVPLRLPDRHPLEAPAPAYSQAVESEAVERAIALARTRDPAQLSYDEFAELVEAVSAQFSLPPANRDGRPSALVDELARRLRTSDISLFRDHLDLLEPLPPLEPDGDHATPSGRSYLRELAQREATTLEGAELAPPSDAPAR